ncbi:MAG: type II secretion system protein GspE, partial [Defluviitaleaceae bacterium]|nr:type II secretion system protein GspE [Defluviitaleaceae bacterium]
MAKKKLGDMLVEAGFLTPEQSEECLAILEKAPERRLGDIVIEKGYVTQQELFRILENQHKTPFV